MWTGETMIMVNGRKSLAYLGNDLGQRNALSMLSVHTIFGIERRLACNRIISVIYYSPELFFVSGQT